MMEMYVLYALLAGTSAVAVPKVLARLELSRAKHRSLAGHAKMSRQIAKWVPFYEYDEADFFRADGAPNDIAAIRRAAFGRMSALYETRFAASAKMTAEVAPSISDLQFTAHYRVPFQFSRHVREHLKGGSFLASAECVMVTDLDGNQFFDLTRSLPSSMQRL